MNRARYISRAWVLVNTGAVLAGLALVGCTPAGIVGDWQFEDAAGGREQLTILSDGSGYVVSSTTEVTLPFRWTRVVQGYRFTIEDEEAPESIGTLRWNGTLAFPPRELDSPPAIFRRCQPPTGLKLEDIKLKYLKLEDLRAKLTALGWKIIRANPYGSSARVVAEKNGFFYTAGPYSVYVQPGHQTGWGVLFLVEEGFRPKRDKMCVFSIEDVETHIRPNARELAYAIRAWGM